MDGMRLAESGLLPIIDRGPRTTRPSPAYECRRYLLLLFEERLPANRPVQDHGRGRSLLKLGEAF